MSIATLVTEGYGSFGSIARIVTEGFSLTGVVVVKPTPTDRIITVAAEGRALVLSDEARLVSVASESRTITAI